MLVRNSSSDGDGQQGCAVADVGQLTMERVTVDVIVHSGQLP